MEVFFQLVLRAPPLLGRYPMYENLPCTFVRRFCRSRTWARETGAARPEQHSGVRRICRVRLGSSRWMSQGEHLQKVELLCRNFRRHALPAVSGIDFSVEF